MTPRAPLATLTTGILTGVGITSAAYAATAAPHWTITTLIYLTTLTTLAITGPWIGIQLARRHPPRRPTEQPITHIPDIGDDDFHRFTQEFTQATPSDIYLPHRHTPQGTMTSPYITHPCTTCGHHPDWHRFDDTHIGRGGANSPTDPDAKFRCLGPNFDGCHQQCPDFTGEPITLHENP